MCQDRHEIDWVSSGGSGGIYELYWEVPGPAAGWRRWVDRGRAFFWVSVSLVFLAVSPIE